MLGSLGLPAAGESFGQAGLLPVNTPGLDHLDVMVRM